MQALARARLSRDWPAARIHPGDLDWWVVQTYGRAPGMTERVRLWLGPDDELVAFAWFSPPADLDFLVGPDEPPAVVALVAEILDWAEIRHGALGGAATATAGAGAATAFGGAAPAQLRAWVAASDQAAMGGLDALGLGPEARPGLVQFTGDLTVADAWPATRLPPGLALRALSSEPDIEARVICGRAAFPASTMTAERYRTVRRAWLYRADLDLQLVAADGRVVAFALGWFDPMSGVVELEPVGVHPEWHRRGLGGHICRAVLRTARTLGARRAMVAAERTNDAALALYASLGLAITTDIVAFTRPIMEQPAITVG